MVKLPLRVSLATLLFGATAATATNYTADPTNFNTVFNEVQSGDKITLTGNFGAVKLANRSFAIPVQINAYKASFSDTLSITDVSGLAFTGGHYGSATSGTHYNAAVAGQSVDNVSFANAYVVGADLGTGIRFSDSTHVKVTGSTFKRLHSSIDIVGSTGVVIDNNRGVGAASDGADIVDSHLVSVTNGGCSGGDPTTGSHADCVQLFSKPGNPVQSQIVSVLGFPEGSWSSLPCASPGRICHSLYRPS